MTALTSGMIFVLKGERNACFKRSSMIFDLL
uniref:Uncharacterized protein n=1 Tax=Arundo donax TaxID=35708 RepID=A0A0A9EMG5_ARUDO